MVKINTDWDMAVPLNTRNRGLTKFRLQTHSYNLKVKV